MRSAPLAFASTQLRAAWRNAHGLDRLNAEPRFQGVVHRLRIGFAAGLLHHLSDEPAEHRWLRLRLRNLIRISVDDGVDRGGDGVGIGDLLQSELLNFGAWAQE